MFSIAGLFTREAIVRYLKSLPVLKTPVMDSIFTDRPQLGLPLVGADMILETAHALPVVRRGSPSIPVTSESGSTAFYEPLPIRPSKQVSGVDLNNIKLLGQSGRDAWATERTDTLRRAVRKTVEALCAVALSGTLQWPIKLEGAGFEIWEIVFGTILSETPGKLWSADGAKLKDVFALLQAMQEKIQEKGYGGTVEIWAGKTAYETLFGLAEASTTTAKLRLEITDAGINVGGFLVKRRAERYRNPQNGAMVPVLADTKVRMIATDAGHKLPYCALDDLDANLQPLPFFVKPIKQDDPSGWKLVAESKPFPIPNTNGICDATAVSS